ncbi:hypothetical protein E2O03_013000 [Candidatus Magnetomonas plexicatena]|nr:hypothetical protein E2O03_013000 [Nitrospirales bacterium LBB_01]
MKAIKDRFEFSYDNDVVMLSDLKKMSDLYVFDLVSTVHKVQASKVTWEEGIKAVMEAQQKSNRLWNSIKANTLTAEELQLIAETEPLVTSVNNVSNQLIDIMSQKDKTVLKTFRHDNLYSAVDPLIHKLAELSDVQLKQSKEQLQSSKISYIRSKNILMFGVLSVLFLSFFGTAYIVGIIIKKTKAIIKRERDLQVEELRNAIILLDTTGHIARIGGWTLNVDTMKISWTREVYDIHEIDVIQPLDFNTALEFYPPEVRPDLIAQLNECLTTGKNMDIELPFITTKGSRLWINIQANAQYKKGKIVRLIGSFQDITRHKYVEDELKRLNNNLNDMVIAETEKRLKQEQMLIQQSKMASMGEMIGLIAHQWRQPLNAVGITIQDLEDAYKCGEVNDKYIDNVVDTTMKQVYFMSKTVDDFRDFFIPSKEKALFDVKLNIEELLSMFGHVFSKSNIHVSLQVEEDTFAFTDGYPNELKQVILNILNNSSDAIVSKNCSKVQGTIEIGIGNNEDKSEVLLSIKDNGGGIPENVIERIFEPYFTTKGTDGTGVGLYMSKTIIETNMGGSLTVRNVDDGAEFVIRLITAERQSEQQQCVSAKVDYNFSKEEIMYLSS